MAVTRAGATVTCDLEVGSGKAYATISAAVGAASAGQTICVAPGAYADNVTIGKSLALLGPQAGVTPVDGGRTGNGGEAKVTSLQPGAWSIFSVQADNVTIKGFEIANGYESIAVPVASGTRTGLTISDNWIHSNANWSLITTNQNTSNNVTDVTIDGNLLVVTGNYPGKTGTRAISLSGNGVNTNVVISDNVVDATGNRFIFAGGSPASYLINTMAITGNVILGGSFNLGNIVDGAVTGNVFHKAGYIGIDNSDYPTAAGITGNTFTDGAYLGLWGESYGFTRPSRDLEIANNLFDADSVLYLDDVGYDPSTLSIHDNGFPVVSGAPDCAGEAGYSPVYGPNYDPSYPTAGGTLEAAGNWWGSATGPSLGFCGFDEARTSPWIHAYTPDATKAGLPGFWPTQIVQGFPAGTPSATGTGSDVAQAFFDDGAEAGSITFDSVTAAGETTVTPSRTSYPTEPSGFGLGDPPVYYEITTTAVFTGPIEVCLNYTGSYSPRPQMLHYEGGAWKDVTTSVHATDGIVCGSVTSLSPFALGSGLKRPVTINAASESKAYDGTTASTGTPTVDASTPLVSGDHLDGCTQSFDSAAPGSRTLTASGCRIVGSAGDVTGAYTITYKTAAGTISGAKTTMAITNKPTLASSSAAGAAVKVTWKVTSAAGTVGSGTVKVTDDLSGAACSASVTAGYCTIALTVAGSHTLTASYSGGGNFAAGDPDTATHPVTAGALAKLVVSPNPAGPVGPNEYVSFAARGADKYGNDRGEMTTLTSFTVTNGTCALNVCRSAKAGTQTVTAIYGKLTGTGALLVAAGDPDHLVFTAQPQSTKVKTTMKAVRVGIADAWGNIVTSVTDVSITIGIDLASNPSGGKLSGSLTRSIQSGVATFDNLSIDRVGKGYALRAANVTGYDPLLFGATSNKFDITK